MALRKLFRYFLQVKYTMDQFTISLQMNYPTEQVEH